MSDNGKKIWKGIACFVVTILISVVGYAYASHENKIIKLQETKAESIAVEKLGNKIDQLEIKIDNKADKGDTQRIENKVDNIYLLLVRMKNKDR